MARINIDGVSKQFEEENPVLSDLSLEVESGEFVAVVGPSGAGKSTLLRVIAGFEKPESGTVKLPDSTSVGFVFQDHALFPWKTAAQNIRFALKSSGQDIDSEKISQALKQVDLLDAAGRYPHELSGGMKQRLALARTLAQDPDIILMDEPFSSLDELTKRKLYTEFTDIVHGTGKTIVYVTHDIKEAYLFSDRILTLSNSGELSSELKPSGTTPRQLEDLETDDFLETRDRILDDIDLEVG